MPSSSLSPRERRGLLAFTALLVTASLLLSMRDCGREAAPVPVVAADTLVIVSDTVASPPGAKRATKARKAVKARRQTAPPTYRSPLDEPAAR